MPFGFSISVISILMFNKVTIWLVTKLQIGHPVIQFEFGHRVGEEGMTKRQKKTKRVSELSHS